MTDITTIRTFTVRRVYQVKLNLNVARGDRYEFLVRHRDKGSNRYTKWRSAKDAIASAPLLEIEEGIRNACSALAHQDR